MQHSSETLTYEEGSNMAGGRMTFERDQLVRILTLDSRISSEEYTVDTEKADRRGHIALTEVGTSRQIKVNQRRVLVNCLAGEVFVVQSGDKFRAVCPKCPHVEEVTPSDNSIECPTHGSFPLHWRKGERPMADTAEKKLTKPAKPATTKPAAEKKPSPEKKQKAIKEAIRVDLSELRDLKGCELWTKKVKFDHEKIDVQAHVLLFVGASPRKLCFNTYDGTLGKKGVPLPIQDFVKDNGDGKKTWFPISDVEKTKTKLAKEGYEKE